MDRKTTKYLTDDDADLQLAAEMLRNGGTVIFPTETVYGLGANALDPNAAAKIFKAKGRPSDNPLIVHISKMEDLKNIAAEVPESAKKLMDKFWPGPLTLIFKKKDRIPSAVTGGLDTVAVRMPQNRIARALIEKAGLPIAAPSANLSGKPSPTIIAHVKEDMDGRVDAVIDGGDCEVGLESAVLDVSVQPPVLYRPGRITAEDIESVIGEIKTVTKAAEGEKPKSPGLKYRHYAPKAEVRILHGSAEQVGRYASALCDKDKTGMLVFDEFPQFDDRLITYSLGSRRSPGDAAHRLFTALRVLDSKGVSVILAPEIPDNGLWSAVKNRLYRAAADTIIDLTKSVKSVLFVCTGNTCRSPMAEGLMKNLDIDGIKALSAGIAAAEGAPASQNAVFAMQEKNIDLSGHRARQITRKMIDDSDLVLTMTEGHKNMLIHIMPDAADKIKTLAEWADSDMDISDPYGGDLERYRLCRNQIEKLLLKGREKLN